MHFEIVKKRHLYYTFKLNRVENNQLSLPVFLADLLEHRLCSNKLLELKVSRYINII